MNNINDMQLEAHFNPSIIDATGARITRLKLTFCTAQTYEGHMKEAAKFFKTVMPNVAVEIVCLCHNPISNTFMQMASLYVDENRFVKL